MADTVNPAPIGGYFELELPRGNFPHADGLLLSSGRACIELVLRGRRPARVYVPHYTCDVVVEPIKRLGIAVAFYPVSPALQPNPLPAVAADEMLVANNYFGLQDGECAGLAEQLGNRLILDYSQAYYAAPGGHGAFTFYSPRKFCGVPDGGILTGATPKEMAVAADLPRDRSWERGSHLLQRVDDGAKAGYAAFQRNDASLTNLLPMRMSHLTRRLLEAQDHIEARRRRRANFAVLHAALGTRNTFTPPPLDSFECPMVYPFRTANPDLRRRLIAADIFVATYWPNVRRWCAPDSEEYRLTEDLLPLPIDQRYGTDDMERIIEVMA